MCTKAFETIIYYAECANLLCRIASPGSSKYRPYLVTQSPHVAPVMSRGVGFELWLNNIAIEFTIGGESAAGDAELAGLQSTTMEIRNRLIIDRGRMDQCVYNWLIVSHDVRRKISL